MQLDDNDYRTRGGVPAARRRLSLAGTGRGGVALGPGSALRAVGLAHRLAPAAPPRCTAAAARLPAAPAGECGGFAGGACGRCAGVAARVGTDSSPAPGPFALPGAQPGGLFSSGPLGTAWRLVNAKLCRPQKDIAALRPTAPPSSAQLDVPGGARRAPGFMTDAEEAALNTSAAAVVTALKRASAVKPHSERGYHGSAGVFGNVVAKCNLGEYFEEKGKTGEWQPVLKLDGKVRVMPIGLFIQSKA